MVHTASLLSKVQKNRHQNRELFIAGQQQMVSTGIWLNLDKGSAMFLARVLKAPQKQPTP